MFGILDYLKIGAGLALGIVLMLGYNALIHDPMVEREARAGYVLEAQKTALEAKLTEQQRQTEAGKLVIASYQEVLKNARADEAEKSQQIETEIAGYEVRLKEAGRRCDLDASDIDFLRQ